MSKKIETRKWLNKKSGTAFVSLDIEEFEASTIFNKEFSATLKIADCNRYITLEFDFHDEKGQKERLFKLAQLEEQLKILRKHIENFKHEKKLPRKKESE